MRRKIKGGEGLSEEIKIKVLLFLIAFLSSIAFIYPGYPTAGDTWPHLVRTKIVSDWLKEGEFPFFSFFFYSGYPALRFYSPLFPFLTGLFATFLGIFWATKLVLFFINILSGFTFFLFLKRTGHSLYHSFFGSCVYLLIPWRMMYVGGIATYPLSLCFLFLPLSFLALENLFAKPNFRSSLLFSLSLFALIISHFIYALWSFLFLFVYFLFRRQFSSGVFLFIFFGLLFAFLQSSFFLLPFLLKFSSYSFPQNYQKLPSPNPIVLLGFRSEIGGYTGAYLGLSVIFLLVLAFISRGKERRLFKDGIAISLLLSLVLTFLPALLRKGEGLLTAGLPPQRFLFFFAFFSGIMVLSGLSFLEEKLLKFSVREKQTFFFLFSLVLIDCLPRLFPSLYSDKKELLGLREEIYELLKREKVEKLADIDIPTEGIDIFKRVCRYPAQGFIFAGLANVYGPPYHQFAPKNMLYLYPWINFLASDLGDSQTRRLSERSLKIIRLAGISHIITLPTLIGGGPEQTIVLLKEGLLWDDRFILAERKPPLAIGKYPYSSFFLCANKLKPLPRERIIPEKSFFIAEDWASLLDEVEIDHEKGSLSFIPILEGQGEEEFPGEEPVLTFAPPKIEHGAISAEVSLSKDCFLRASCSFYPEIKVLVDGKEVRVFETKDHFLAFPITRGTHQVKIISGGIATYGANYLSLFTILFSLAFLIRRKRNE